MLDLVVAQIQTQSSKECQMPQIQLKSITCEITEDFTGPDEAILIVNGTPVFGPFQINSSQTVDLSNVDSISFGLFATISLLEQDSGPFDADDHLGTISVANSQVDGGSQEGVFNLSGALYRLSYEVSEVIIGSNFTFADEITDENREKLIERHKFAFSRIQICGNLTDGEKLKLTEAYARPISHGIEDNPNANASAFVNGSELFVNFEVLFPKGDQEIAQTLIHEMMHCAGFSHPNRRLSDQPGDGGPYYGSPPLQAELCIAGQQSDMAFLAGEKADLLCAIQPDGRSVLYADKLSSF